MASVDRLRMKPLGQFVTNQNLFRPPFCALPPEKPLMPSICAHIDEYTYIHSTIHTQNHNHESVGLNVGRRYLTLLCGLTTVCNVHVHTHAHMHTHTCTNAVTINIIENTWHPETQHPWYTNPPQCLGMQVQWFSLGCMGHQHPAACILPIQCRKKLEDNRKSAFYPAPAWACIAPTLFTLPPDMPGQLHRGYISSSVGHSKPHDHGREMSLCSYRGQWVFRNYKWPSDHGHQEVLWLQRTGFSGSGSAISTVALADHRRDPDLGLTVGTVAFLQIPRLKSWIPVPQNVIFLQAGLS